MEKTSLIHHLSTTFLERENALNGKAQSPLYLKKKEAMRVFEALGFPSIRHEEWKYSNLANLSKKYYHFAKNAHLSSSDVKKMPLPHLKGNILYFVNGLYNAELSSIISSEKQLKISSFAEAFKNKNSTLQQHFASLASVENHALNALNTALAQDGVVIEIASHQVVEEPIILRFISDVRKEATQAHIRNLIVVGENAQVKIAEAYRTIGDLEAFTNTLTEIKVAANAHVEYYKVQNESNQTHHIGTTEVRQAEKSHFYAATITVNGGFTRNNLHVLLDGQHCEAFMYGLYTPNGTQHIDNHTAVDHAKPNCESNELYKGILRDNSSGVFNGKIFVREDAQKTNAYQNCRNVVLEDASMNTKPQLEIWADDVKCSHGTTTGKLNEEALFYMQSRGIPKNQAQRLLMLAFAQDVVDKVRIDSIREYLQGLILEKLHE